MNLKVTDITINKGRRAVDEAKVKSLVDSINEIGLINPITVTKESVLIAGLHRLSAVKQLGWENIAVTIMDNGNSLHTELAEIDENLIRNELHWVEQDEAMKRRKEIYELLHPETKHVTKRGGSGRGNKTSDIMSDVLPFTEDTAQKTGKSSRSVRRSVQRVQG